MKAKNFNMAAIAYELATGKTYDFQTSEIENAGVDYSSELSNFISESINPEKAHNKMIEEERKL